MKHHLFFSFFLISLLTFSSCRQTVIKVRKKANNVEFRLTNTSTTSSNYRVGYTYTQNTVSHAAQSLEENSSLSYKVVLGKGDEYYFSVMPYFNNTSLQMDMYVEGQLYKRISDPDLPANKELIISGKLQTLKE